MEVIMERFKSKFVLIIMLVGILLLTGCGKFRLNTNQASDEVTVTPGVTQNNQEKETNQNNGELGSTNTDGNSVTKAVTKPVANKELSVYTVNADDGNLEPVIARVQEGSPITPELVVKTVIEAMADQSIFVATDSVTSKDDTVIVSFQKDKAPYSNMGSGYEAAILNAIAQSLIDDLDGYNKVIYRVEGKAYESDAFKMGINEVYMQK
jgi:Sporulation and spore germination.